MATSTPKFGQPLPGLAVSPSAPEAPKGKTNRNLTKAVLVCVIAITALALVGASTWAGLSYLDQWAKLGCHFYHLPKEWMVNIGIADAALVGVFGPSLAIRQLIDCTNPHSKAVAKAREELQQKDRFNKADSRAVLVKLGEEVSQGKEGSLVKRVESTATAHPYHTDSALGKVAWALSHPELIYHSLIGDAFPESYKHTKDNQPALLQNTLPTTQNGASHTIVLSGNIASDDASVAWIKERSEPVIYCDFQQNGAGEKVRKRNIEGVFQARKAAGKPGAYIPMPVNKKPCSVTLSNGRKFGWGRDFSESTGIQDLEKLLQHVSTDPDFQPIGLQEGVYDTCIGQFIHFLSNKDVNGNDLPEGQRVDLAEALKDLNPKQKTNTLIQLFYVYLLFQVAKTHTEGYVLPACKQTVDRGASFDVMALVMSSIVKGTDTEDGISKDDQHLILGLLQRAPLVDNRQIKEERLEVVTGFLKFAGKIGYRNLRELFNRTSMQAGAARAIHPI